MQTISKETLIDLYNKKRKSSAEIGQILRCSENKVNYWIKKYNIKKRSISDASYIKWNPNGHPFKIRENFKISEFFLYGIGVGLYWGEGNKRNQYSIRLGNSDPALIIKFIDFLKIIYNIDQDKLRFGLQIFNDLSEEEVFNYWLPKLKVDKNKFYKTIITPSKNPGTYKNKSKYGVVTVYYNNKKLRDILYKSIENLQTL